MTTLRIVHRGDAEAGLNGTMLFGILWDGLADLLGTSATAVLLRRAARRAASSSQELGALAIERVDEEFGYVVPQSFDQAAGPPVALRTLTLQLLPLLRESTGEVAIRHLERIPELRRCLPVAAGA
jgi:hypothetical protein